MYGRKYKVQFLKLSDLIISKKSIVLDNFPIGDSVNLEIFIVF